MDIVKIGATKGHPTKFLDVVHPSQHKRCARYVEKCGGPSEIFTNPKKKSALDFLDEAFEGFQQYKDKIGLVIDASTTRGFTEPSQASLYAMHLGLTSAACFDVTEACNGWCRAAETAYYYFNCRKEMEDKYILIINNEYPPETRAVVPESDDDYQGCASYYVGLSFSYTCTATLLKKSNNRSWKFVNLTDTTYASYINIPMPKIAQDFLPKCKEYDVKLTECYGQYCLPKYHRNEKNGLYTLGVIETMKEFYQKANVICHTFTKKVFEQIFEFSDFKKLSLYYNETGNLGSCSLPYILNDQYGQELPQNEHIAFIGTAAGGSGTIVTFVQGQDDGPLLQNQMGNDEVVKPVGKYELLFKMGMRTLVGKLFCLKKDKNYSPQSQAKKNV